MKGLGVGYKATAAHVECELFDGTDVELHAEPAYFCNPFANRRFRKWFMEYDKSRFMISDKGFCVPDAEFNRVFLLAHAFRHYMSEGLGLRQVMDYYFLLQNLNVNHDHDNLIKRLGMARFEKAMKWVIGYVFEGKDVEDGRKYGKMLEKYGSLELRISGSREELMEFWISGILNLWRLYK